MDLGGVARERVIDQSPQGLFVWQHSAVEHDAVTVSDQQGRKILDVKIADHLLMIFNVDPHRVDTVRTVTHNLIEERPIRAAGPAPFGAKAGDQQAGFRHGARV